MSGLNEVLWHRRISGARLSPRQRLNKAVLLQPRSAAAKLMQNHLDADPKDLQAKEQAERNAERDALHGVGARHDQRDK